MLIDCLQMPSGTQYYLTKFSNSFDGIENKHYLQALVEITNFAQIVEELVYPGLVVLDKRVESHHVGLLGVGGLVGQVLEQLGNL